MILIDKQVHTDANFIAHVVNPFDGKGGLGMWQQSGHIDIYPNGGKRQPGCVDTGPIGQILDNGISGGMEQIFACAHLRA